MGVEFVILQTGILLMIVQQNQCSHTAEQTPAIWVKAVIFKDLGSIINNPAGGMATNVTLESVPLTVPLTEWEKKVAQAYSAPTCCYVISFYRNAPDWNH